VITPSKVQGADHLQEWEGHTAHQPGHWVYRVGFEYRRQDFAKRTIRQDVGLRVDPAVTVAVYEFGTGFGW